MVLNKVVLNNFMGVQGEVSFTMPHILALVGKNGMGKTTVLNAIRYALTGEEPDGDIINSEVLLCSVKIFMTTSEGTELSFERIKDRERTSKCKLNGKVVTKKVMDEKIEDIVGIPLDKIKILSSADVVAAMKPQEFASLILGYIPEKLTLEKVISFMPTSTIGALEIMETNLPEEGIDIAILDNFDSTCRDIRKAKKAELAAKKLVADEKKCDKPEVSKESLEKELNTLLNLENEKNMYEVKKSAYEREVENIKKIDDQVKSLKMEADTISVTRPDPAALTSYENEKISLEKSLAGQKEAVYGMKSAISTLQTTLTAIDASVCPISPLIKCGTDKSEARAEIVESIEATENGIKAVETEIAKIEENIKAVDIKIADFSETSKLYEKKLELLKQAKVLEDSKPSLSAPPAPVEIPEDLEAKVYQLKNALKLYDNYSEYNKLLAQIASLETEVADYELLVKLMADKGAVRTGIVNSYLSVFEDICNERSAAIRPDVTFKFESKNGVVVKMSTGSGVAPLQFENLSGGERAYMLYIIIDMLNQLVGTRLLVLDELSVIDEETINVLLELILSHSADYDHIVLSAVDHADTVNAFKAHSIPFISEIDGLTRIG